MRIRLLICGVGLFSTACPADATSDTAVTTVVEVDRKPYEDCVTGAPTVVSDDAVEFSFIRVRAGESFEFEVAHDEETLGETITGDEIPVECWDGNQWKNAYRVYFAYDPARAYVHYGAGVLTDDAFGQRRGVIVTPFDAPAGDYRVTFDFRYGTEGERLAPTGYFKIDS